MGRRIRYYQKKRGNRRTGSTMIGRVGEVLFFAVFLLLGGGGLVAWLAVLVIPEWRVNHEFREATCKIVGAELKEKKTAEGILYRPEFKIEYEVDGETYYAWTYDIATARDLPSSYSGDRPAQEAVLERFAVEPGRPPQHVCWYNPADPGVAVLVRGYSWWIWLLLVIPLSFIVIGGGGLIHWVFRFGRSAEHHAVMVQRARDRDPFAGNGQGHRKFPNVPDGANITNSPGIRLKFRLPIETSPGWTLFVLLVACVIWNVIVSGFLAHAIRGHLAGDPDWLLTVFVIPFVVGGVALAVFFVRQLLVTTGIGPTQVEISDHPLRPGESYRLFVSQSGRLHVNSLAVLLICEEEATYRQGTNTRTETREVLRAEVLRREGFAIRHGVPFETEGDFCVPATAMHSFKADHNQITWKVVVHSDVRGWPDYQRAFPVILQPNDEGDRA